MHVAGYYGAAVVVMLALVWASQSHVLQKLGLCLMYSWIATQAADAVAGLQGTPAAMPWVQGFLAVVVGVVGASNRRHFFTSLAVFVLYGLLIGVHLGAHILQRTGEFPYFATLNALFSLQLLIVGVVGATGAVRYWLPRIGQRIGAVRPGRA